MLLGGGSIVLQEPEEDESRKAPAGPFVQTRKSNAICHCRNFAINWPQNGNGMLQQQILWQ